MVWNGYIKVASLGPEIRLMDLDYNKELIEAGIEIAKDDDVNIAVFPELSLTGATAGDAFYNTYFIKGAMENVKALAQATKRCNMWVILGAPFMYEGALYDAAYLLYDGKIKGIVPKENLTREEKRYFVKAPKNLEIVKIDGEEIPFGNDLLFTDKSGEVKLKIAVGDDIKKITETRANVLCHIAAKEELMDTEEKRIMKIKVHSSDLGVGYVFSNAPTTESTSEKVFGGHLIIAEDGKIVDEKKPFTAGNYLPSFIDAVSLKEKKGLNLMTDEKEISSGALDFINHEEIKIDKFPFTPKEETALDKIIEIGAQGLKRRMEHTFSETAVIGVSGGLDSTVALLIVARCFDLLGKDRKGIIAVTMPSFGTTKKTKGNAEKLCEALGIDIRTIDIKKAVSQHFKDIGHAEDDFGVTYENAQARERTQVLMDLANKEKGLVVGTGDLSELALGFATFNGDQMSMYSVNATTPKTLLRHIVERVIKTAESEELKKVLEDILYTPISPELLPADKGEIAQKTEDLIGPYELHDFFLYYFCKIGATPERILELAKKAFSDTYDEKTIKMWLMKFLKRFFTQQFKRSAMPDGPKVQELSFSPRGELLMPSDANGDYFLRELEAEVKF